MAYPTHYTGNLFDVTKDPSTLGNKDFYDHIAVESKTGGGWLTSATTTSKSGTAVAGELEALVKQNGDKFNFEPGSLKNALIELENHERIFKITKGSHLTEKQLKTHAEAAYKEIKGVKLKAAETIANLQKGSISALTKLKDFHTHHAAEISKGEQNASLKSGSKVKIDTLGMAPETQSEVAKYLGKNTGDFIEEKELAAARAKLDAHYTAASNRLTEILEGDKQYFEKLNSHLDTESARVKTMSGIADTTPDIKLPATVAEGKLAPIGEAKYKEFGMFKKIGTDMKFAWNHSSGWGKGARVAGTGVGVVILGSGLANIATGLGMSSPKLDENGKEVEISRAGELFKGLAKVGAGGAAAYFSLTKGGKALATGV